jgi:hypothetical protein
MTTLARTSSTPDVDIMGAGSAVGDSHRLPSRMAHPRESEAEHGTVRSVRYTESIGDLHTYVATA